MDDFNALAAALGADVDGVRASLILSRDGLVMGAHPDGGEAIAKPVWMRFANLGDPERGFLQFGTETWCYVRRGPYAAFVVAVSSVRPGLVIDQMERVLLTAEESRADRGSLKADAPAAAPSGTAPASKPRTPLHREPAPDDEPIVIHHAKVAATPEAAAAEASTPAAEAAATTEPAPETADAESDAQKPGSTARRRAAPSMWATDTDEEDVDRFSLAREFGQLLQDDETNADG
jgi:hypothetical protein